MTEQEEVILAILTAAILIGREGISERDILRIIQLESHRAEFHSVRGFTEREVQETLVSLLKKNLVTHNQVGMQ